jgi:endonuclease YncB( thermonuclease family)
MTLNFNTFVLASSLLTVPQCGFAKREEEPTQKISAEIIHCHDGDTCNVVLTTGIWMNVRLAGIDAPEVGRYGKSSGGGQPLGDAAREALTTLVVHKKSIFIRQVDIDPYNRPVVEVFDGRDLINVKMLELGMAERYTGRTRGIDRAKYSDAEQKSKSGKIGIWGISHYASPKSWRSEVNK